jgi:hypothetical protein
MSLIIDAGAFIAFERGDRTIQALLESAADARTPVRTSTAIVAQVWRDGAKQARLTRILRGIEEVALTQQRARSVGSLLRTSRTHDIADATLVELAENGDEILTSDPDDILRVATHAGKTLIVTTV